MQVAWHIFATPLSLKQHLSVALHTISISWNVTLTGQMCYSIWSCDFGFCADLYSCILSVLLCVSVTHLDPRDREHGKFLKSLEDRQRHCKCPAILVYISSMCLNQMRGCWSSVQFTKFRKPDIFFPKDSDELCKHVLNRLIFFPSFLIAFCLYYDKCTLLNNYMYSRCVRTPDCIIQTQK